MADQANIKRREFLQTAAGAAGIIAGFPYISCGGRIHTKGESSSNILLIMTDEHNASVLGCYGNHISRTPNLDRLADQGITFENAYTNSPLCGPARLSFTSGKYVSRVHLWNNVCWLPAADYTSLPRLLNAEGYESYLCGKMHFDPTRNYGYIRTNPHYREQDVKTGRGERRDPDDMEINTRLRDMRFSEFHPADESRFMDHDNTITEEAITFLSNLKRSERPFFLAVGYITPHFPLIAPQEYWEPYINKVPMPYIPPGHIESLPLNYHHLRRAFGIVETDPEMVKKGRELYYGLVQWTDNEIGKLIKGLEKSDVADNTIVIYTTDHGENMGEHGLWWKNCMFDHAARIPLIISNPERWKGGQKRKEVCSLIDLAATIAEIGGVEVPEDWDGNSLCSLMDDPSTEWKNFAISEYYGHNIASGFAMIRRGNYKYVYHTKPAENYPAERELYDLDADPGEFQNLASNPDQKKRIEMMHAALVKELGNELDDIEQQCRAELARGYERTDIPNRKE